MLFDFETNTEYKAITFPGGERHLVIKDAHKYNGVNIRIRNSDNVMDLLLAADAITNAGGQLKHLVLPYVPYGRQDRYTEEGGAFSLRVFLSLVNSLGFNLVEIFEPHSSVTPALIESPVLEKNADFVFSRFLGDTLGYDKKPLVVAPDGGAVKRVERFLKYDATYAKIATEDLGVILKRRNPKTGWVDVVSATPNIFEHNDIVFYDDICDGGATFLQGEKYLRDNGFKGNISLFTAHAMYSKGTKILLDKFSFVGTTNSFWRPKQDEPLDKSIFLYGV